MVRASINGQMAHVMRESFCRAKNMGLQLALKKTEQNSQESIKMTKNMVLELSFSKAEVRKLDIGKKVS